MKKLNKKGFTLIELLAVIVVLAVIMVIATQQVNRTIKKARTNSFNESMQSIVKSAKLLIAESDLTEKNLQDSMDYSTGEYTISYNGGTQSGTITIAATNSGKFNNIDFSLMSNNDKISGYLYDQTNKKICTYLNDEGEASIPTDASGNPKKTCN